MPLEPNWRRLSDDIAPVDVSPRTAHSELFEQIALDVQSSTEMQSIYDDDIAPDEQPSRADQSQLIGETKSCVPRPIQFRYSEEIAPDVLVPKKAVPKFDDEIARDVLPPSYSSTVLSDNAASTSRNGHALIPADISRLDLDERGLLDRTPETARPKPKLVVQFEGVRQPTARKGSIYEQSRKPPRRTGSVALGSPFPKRSGSIAHGSPTSSRSDSMTLDSPSSTSSASTALGLLSSRRISSVAPDSPTSPTDPNNPLSTRKKPYTQKRSFSVAGFSGSYSPLRGSMSGPSPGAPRRVSFFRRADGSAFAS